MRALDQLPAWLRWALFLPVGLASHFIVATMIEALLGAAGLRAGRGFPNAVAVGAILAFLSGVTFTLFPSLLSPKPRVVALVLFACGVVSDLAQIGYYARYEYMRPRLPLAAGMAGVEAVGGLLAVFLAWRLARPRLSVAPSGASPSPTA